MSRRLFCCFVCFHFMRLHFVVRVYVFEEWGVLTILQKILYKFNTPIPYIPWNSDRKAKVYFKLFTFLIFVFDLCVCVWLHLRRKHFINRPYTTLEIDGGDIFFCVCAALNY